MTNGDQEAGDGMKDQRSAHSSDLQYLAGRPRPLLVRDGEQRGQRHARVQCADRPWVDCGIAFGVGVVWLLKNRIHVFLIVRESIKMIFRKLNQNLHCLGGRIRLRFTNIWNSQRHSRNDSPLGSMITVCISLSTVFVGWRKNHRTRCHFQKRPSSLTAARRKWSRERWAGWSVMRTESLLLLSR